MHGHADLDIGAEDIAGFTGIAIVLPEMDAVGAQPLGQADAVVDDEGDVAVGADFL